LRDVRSPVLDELLPGLGPEQLRSLARDVPFELGSDLEDLYAWRNGTNDSKPGVPALFPGGLFLRAQAAVAEYGERVKAARQVAPDDQLAAEIYHPRWFPVFLDAGGSVHVVELSEEDRGTVWFVPLEEPDLRFRAAPSLARLIEFVVACYERGAYFIRADGRDVDVDLKREAEIARQRLDPAPNVAALVQEVASLDSTAASRAFDAIRRLRFPEAVPHLTGLLDHDDPGVRRRAGLLLDILKQDHSAAR